VNNFDRFSKEFSDEITFWRQGFKDLQYNLCLYPETGLCVCEVTLYNTRDRHALYIDEDEQPGYTIKHRTGDHLACEMCFYVTGNIKGN
jgi:hypothetical protein